MIQNRIVHLRDRDGNIYGELKQNLESFTNFSKHSHTTLNLCMIRDGDIDIIYHPNDLVRLHPQQIAIFYPQEVHITGNPSIASLPYYNLHLEVSWVMDIIQEECSSDELIYLTSHIIEDCIYAKELTSIIKQINDNHTSKIEVSIANLIIEIFRNHTAKSGSIETEKLFDEIKAYILEHIDQEISATTIANHTGYSTAHISRRFKEQFGLTLQAFLIDKRIQHAKALMLKDNKLSLTEIALEAGFYDQSHFIKNFKKAYSISPNAYKV